MGKWVMGLTLLFLLRASTAHMSSGEGGRSEGNRRLLKRSLDPDGFRSQIGQDKWVVEHFPGPGFYFDIGARDGVKISNSYALDKRGWKGVCVEPSPTRFDDRSCVLAREVVTNETGVTIVFASSINKGFGGINSTFEEGVKHTAKVRADKRTKYIEWTSISIGDLLIRYKFPKIIDYWSLDVEGAEYMLLKAFPFCDYYVRLITVEHNRQEPRRTLMRELLEHHGFVLDREVAFDDWYINSNAPPKGQSVQVGLRELHQHAQHPIVRALLGLGAIIVLAATCTRFMHVQGAKP